MQVKPPRRTLTARHPETEALLPDAANDDVRAFARKVWRERNDWSVRRGGSLVHQRLHRRDAGRELRRALAALEKEPEVHHG